MQNRIQLAAPDGHFTDREREIDGIAFVEVVSFIEEIVMNATNTIPAF